MLNLFLDPPLVKVPAADSNGKDIHLILSMGINPYITMLIREHKLLK